MESYLSLVGSRQSQTQKSMMEGSRTCLPTRKCPWFHKQGQVLALLPPSPFPRQHSLGWGTDRHTAPHTAALCLRLSWGSDGQSLSLSSLGRQQKGRNRPSSELAHSPPCWLRGILSKVQPRARKPLQTKHQASRAISHDESQPKGFQKEACYTTQ